MSDPSTKIFSAFIIAIGAILLLAGGILFHQHYEACDKRFTHVDYDVENFTVISRSALDIAECYECHNGKNFRSCDDALRNNMSGTCNMQVPIADAQICSGRKGRSRTYTWIDEHQVVHNDRYQGRNGRNINRRCIIVMYTRHDIIVELETLNNETEFVNITCNEPLHSGECLREQEDRFMTNNTVTMTLDNGNIILGDKSCDEVGKTIIILMTCGICAIILGCIILFITRDSHGDYYDAYSF